MISWRRKPLPLVVFLVVMMVMTPALAEETSTSTTDSSTDSSTTTSTSTTATPPEDADDDFDPSNEDWGSYYDPQNIFCGQFDCYKILGFDYENFGKPSRKMVTQRYRKLSREWHPDKSKHKNAKERFVKIARAYEVLTHKEQRLEYDALRYDQEAYFRKYGTSVLWSYAPKSDTTIVILFLFLLGNVASWFIQKHRWQLVADRLIKAAVEDWAPSQGGTDESKLLREEALELLAKEGGEGGDETTTANGAAADNSPSKGKKKSSGKGKAKLTGKEKKEKEQTLLRPIVTKLVNKMHDFGGGFHKPTWRDLLVVSLVRMPVVVTTGTVWQLGYWIRRLQNKELNDNERQVLTRRAVGPVTWDISSEEEREELVTRELWIKENLLDWKEEQEVKTLSAADQKYYWKMKKKGKLD